MKFLVPMVSVLFVKKSGSAEMIRKNNSKSLFYQTKRAPRWMPKKLLQTCKPDSVPRQGRAVIIYLAAALLQQSCCLPFSLDGPPFPFRFADLRGIAAHKVYPLRQLLAATVSSYLTFSPLSRQWRTVIFCGTVFPPK